LKTIIIVSAILLLILISCNQNDSTNARIEEMSQQRGYANWFLNSFRCGLFVPPGYNPQQDYPLIIFLHGRSDTTTWSLPWYNEPFVSDDPCIVLTPKCPVEEIYGWGDSWDSRVTPMMQKTFEMLDLAKQAFSLDYDRFYIYGSSMGGTGTYGVIGKNPDMFAAAYVECGAGNSEIGDIVAQIPFWIFHGSVDPVVSVSYAGDMYQAVLAAGGTQIRYTEYEGVGHNVWDYTGNETTLNYWLLAQRRGAVHGVPDALSNVSARLDDEQHVLLEWEFPPDLSNPDNQIWYTRIYRDGEIVKEEYNDHFAYTDTSVSGGFTYHYTLTGVNYFFKESSPSNELPIVIP
jgi:predicted peptidase